MLAGELDLGLLIGPAGMGVACEALPEIAWGLVAAPALFPLPSPLPYLQHVYPQDADAGPRPEQLPQPAVCVGRIGSWQLLLQLVLAGIGATFAPLPYVQDELAAGRLRLVDTVPLPRLTPKAVWLAGCELHPAARMLLDLLRREVKP